MEGGPTLTKEGHERMPIEMTTTLTTEGPNKAQGMARRRMEDGLTQETGGYERMPIKTTTTTAMNEPNLDKKGDGG